MRLFSCDKGKMTMRRTRNKKGFTLMEIMLAVAIIVILAGVSFIGVAGYLRSMAQLERDSIAKEIFVAAQNHLAMAEGQNYLNRTGKGVPDFEAKEDGSKKEIYYYIVEAGKVTAGDDDDFDEGLLGLMLPFASIDETVRLGGNYVIRYQAEPANVVDVFYCPTKGKRYLYEMKSDNYSTVKAARGEDKKSDRKRFPEGKGNSVIGWYGGGDGLKKGDELKTPDIKVINKEKLTVKVKDYNPSTTPLQLIITGVSSKAQKAIDLRSTSSPRVVREDSNSYTIILDDITARGMQFSKLGADNGAFWPGEDITVQAVSYRNDVLTNVAYSSLKTTNSLFAKLDMESETSTDDSGNTVTNITSSTASITNIRHLENLGIAVSSVDVKIKLQAATQDSDLSWNDFQEKTNKSNTQIYYSNGSSEGVGCFAPVNVTTYPLAYDGRGHRISDVLISHTGEKGVFGSYGDKDNNGYSIQNLAIVDLMMTSTVLSGGVDLRTGDAGALAGSVRNTSITNVVAYNSSQSKYESGGVLTAGDSSSAGGLIGSMEGGSVTACAAAMSVESKGGNAGGLIGTVSGETTITACYSGGHTKDGQYFTIKEESDDSGNTTSTKTALINVEGAKAVGGLIGAASSATISRSYSTCSVSGSTAGGLVGSGTGYVLNCYSTGLVQGTHAEGAFAGTFGGTANNCRYFEIINERSDAAMGFTYLPAVSGSEVSGIDPLDADVASYQDFVGSSWSDKVFPYDEKLRTYYQNTYNLKTVEQLGATLTVPDSMQDYIDEYFVKTHYGDWPAPEIFVINE